MFDIRYLADFGGMRFDIAISEIRYIRECSSYHIVVRLLWNRYLCTMYDDHY